MEARLSALAAEHAEALAAQLVASEAHLARQREEASRVHAAKTAE